jgi:hypothetical protein
MIIEELYDALVEAGASEGKARAAARALTDYDKRFIAIDQDISEFRSEVDRRFNTVDGTLKLRNWMLATNTAMLIALMFRVFSH